MALTIEEIALLAGETERLLAGRHVGKVYAVEPHRLYLAFRVDKKDVFLFLSTEPGLARFHLLWERPSFPERPSPFSMQLRNELSGKVFARACPLERNRAVRFTFERCDTALVGEFFGQRGNVVLLERDRVVDSLWPLGHGLGKGGAYTLPPAPPDAGSRQHPRYLAADEGGEFPFSTAFARLMAGREQETAFARERDELLTRLRGERKRAVRLCGRLEDDLREAGKAEDYRRMGEALKYHIHAVARGAEQLTLPDPYTPGAEITVALDPARSPHENLEHLFKKYRRLSDAREQIAARHAECAAALQLLERDTAAIEALAWDSPGAREALREIVEGRRRRPRARGARGAKGPRETPAKGPRRFTVRSHLVWVGRNASENADLVRHVARGNDMFLHVAGRPGAVVIVRPPPGKDAAPEALGDAAQLAVFYSIGKDAGAHDVDYTHVKHVRIMGKETGRFTLADRRTLRVTLREDRLQTILESAAAQ